MVMTINKFQYLVDLEYAGGPYLLNFLVDYERFIRQVNIYVPISHILKIWTCIPPSDFMTLTQGDCFYYCGKKMTCTDNAFYQEEQNIYMVEAHEIRNAMNMSLMIPCGDAYFHSTPWNIEPKDYVKILEEAGEIDGRKGKICQKPILITKTSQPIN